MEVFMKLSASLFLLLAGCAAGANQPQAVAPPANFSPVLSLAPLVEAVEPAVVNVYVTSIQRLDISNRMSLLMGLPQEREVQGQGSGFVISADGYILTNNHVAKDAKDIEVKFTSGEKFTATVVGTDPASDIALLKIDAKKTLPYLRLGDSDALRVGDWVMAVGNPLGLGHTVTAGILSGKGRELSDSLEEDFLQTDASINPGNSGGPLVGMDGTVVGMNTAIISGANSVGFAIPASDLKSVVAQLRENGKVSRGFLGVSMSSLSEEGKQLLGTEGGALLVQVAADSPAAKGGLLQGDVVVKVDGHAIADQRDLLQAVAGKSPGTRIKVDLLRQGKPQSLEVILGERPQE